ncbi:histidine kinase [Nocardia yamanashiensis]|uniref:histidine kinase n=1 Tax=Nocardia yamanashiensis TaxID=209247 RepID=UPI001E3ADFE6|nr:histidine kinase [Nocardia yamanashiensis]UGT41632.1 histidine kinase [Nocardia yamanashiensis]
MSPLPRSTGYLFLVSFTLSVLVGGASMVAVGCCAAAAGLLALAQLRVRSRRWVFPVQALLVYLPVAFGDAATNLDGLLAASALRCLPARARWWAFTVIVAGSGFLHGDWRREPILFGYAAVATAAIGVVTYSLLRLPELVDRLRATKDELARAALTQERLRVAGQLHAALGDELSGVRVLLRTARRELGERPERAREAMRRTAAATRRMIETVRATAAVHGEQDGAPRDPEPVSRLAPRLAMAAMVIGLAAWTITQTIESAPAHRLPVAAAGVALTGSLVAQLYRPRLASRILVAQAAIVLLPLPWLESSWCGWLPFLAIPVLLTQRGGRLAAELIGLIVLRALCSEPEAPPGIQAGWVLPVLEATLAQFGLAQFWLLSDQLNRSRAQLVRTTLQVERLRVARNIHDLLGLTLSVLALKSDLIVELVDFDTRRAAAEIDESLRIATDAQREARALAADTVRASLADELSVAAKLLREHGIVVDLDCDDELPDACAAVLSPVAREAITNILRHSDAGYVDIECHRRNDELHLLIRNDGPRTRTSDGQGLRNMRARVSDAGGRFTAVADPDEFVLTAVVPVEPYAECTVPAGDAASATGAAGTTSDSPAM